MWNSWIYHFPTIFQFLLFLKIVFIVLSLFLVFPCSNNMHAFNLMITYIEKPFQCLNIFFKSFSELKWTYSICVFGPYSLFSVLRRTLLQLCLEGRVLGFFRGHYIRSNIVFPRLVWKAKKKKFFFFNEQQKRAMFTQGLEHF